MQEDHTEREKPYWQHDTTDLTGAPRGAFKYEKYLGFNAKELEGKRVLDLGSSSEEFFSSNLKALYNVNAEVVSVNPDYVSNDHRERIAKDPRWQRRSVGAIAQELPFPNGTFDRIYGLDSVTLYADPVVYPEEAQKWALEVGRVLKPGGEASVGPFRDIKKETLAAYEKLADVCRKNGFHAEVVLAPEPENKFELRFQSEKIQPNARFVIRKPAEAS